MDQDAETLALRCRLTLFFINIIKIVEKSLKPFWRYRPVRQKPENQ